MKTYQESENQYYSDCRAKLFRDEDNRQIAGVCAGLGRYLGLETSLIRIVWFLLGKSDFDTETLAFQLTVPGIDEEIMFRGILLGLLATSLQDKILFLGNPSILITAILFGFMHALTLNENFTIDFEPIYFLQTFLAGYIWGWITIKSRSILLAILSHNLSNFFGTLSTMIK